MQNCLSQRRVRKGPFGKSVARQGQPDAVKLFQFDCDGSFHFRLVQPPLVQYIVIEIQVGLEVRLDQFLINPQLLFHGFDCRRLFKRLRVQSIGFEVFSRDAKLVQVRVLKRANLCICFESRSGFLRPWARSNLTLDPGATYPILLTPGRIGISQIHSIYSPAGLSM